MRYCLLLSLSAACLVAPLGRAQEVKQTEQKIQLKLVAKKNTVTWDAGGKTPKEYKKMLDDLADQIKKDPNAGPTLPPPPAVDLVLQIVNTGKKDVTIWVGGDPNEWTFDLKGPGVMAMKPSGAFTLELRLAKPVNLPAGKSYDIPISKLSDGFRGISRNLYWTEPGEYTLSAHYQLGAGQEQKGALLKSNEVKLSVKGK